ncbi:helix-turn-helix domain-containing protein [Pseudomonas chlororaphis]|uniref:helix-turn-helix domain-containing protein n=1 Tax=Pseudomonas chlororaphis TaxID=587753 RepID=UPI0024077CAB|nr:LysR family transcriptional regulator [Pseudomonas chlororaphis]
MNNLEQLANDLHCVPCAPSKLRPPWRVNAARELDVSSAVSHQLHLLESFLQQPLTLRQGRNLILTEKAAVMGDPRPSPCAAPPSMCGKKRHAPGHHQPDPAVRHQPVHSAPGGVLRDHPS